MLFQYHPSGSDGANICDRTTRLVELEQAEKVFQVHGFRTSGLQATGGAQNAMEEDNAMMQAAVFAKMDLQG